MHDAETAVEHWRAAPTTSCLVALAEAVGSVTIAHPTRVAIDGPPAAGKTTLGDELAVVLRAQGREVIHGVDRRASFSPGYSAIGAANTLPTAAITTVSTSTLCTGSCSTRWARAETEGSNRPSTHPHQVPHCPCRSRRYPPMPCSLFDGVFLLRPELIDRLGPAHLRVGHVRGNTGSRPGPETWRCSDPPPKWSNTTASATDPSQQFYFDTVRPTDHADIIVHNDDPPPPAWEARTTLIRHLHCQIGHSCYHGSDSARAVMG